jgi:pimeloyl-ACP methyl ester carboxylesterase
VFATRRGSGPPLLLVHGLGARSGTWSTIAGGLAEQREVIAVDLPGHGRTPAPGGTPSFAGLVDAVEAFINAEDLGEVDMVGSSIGARLVLELARRRVGGRVVALDPGGFWDHRGAVYLGLTLGTSIRLVRRIRPALGPLTGSVVGRSMLFVQLSARPWRLDPGVARGEMESFAATAVFDELLADLVHGRSQPGMPGGESRHRIILGWGRRDRVAWPGQARRAQALFPDAELHWFDHCGHFPHLDQPEATTRLILEATRPSG